MKKGNFSYILIGVFFVLIVGGYFIFSGSTEESIVISDNTLLSQKETNTKTSIFFGSKTTSKEVSELVLDLSELPEGYGIVERAPKTSSEIGGGNLDLGWIEGYYVMYFKGGGNLFAYNKIELSIFRYSLEKMSLALAFDNELEIIEELTIELLPDPKIGEGSRASVIESGEFDLAERVYVIEFYKKDIYVRILDSGTFTDYEFLKELAKKVELKI